MNSQLDFIRLILDSGLVVKCVLLLLTFASVMSWAIIFRQKRLFKNIRKSNQEFMSVYNNSNDVEEILSYSQEVPLSCFATMYFHGLDEIGKMKKVALGPKKQSHGITLRTLERSLKKGVNEKNLIMEEKLVVLASIGSISPFVGLFGTVWGIINSFSGFSSGGATLEAVAPGIAEALVATAAGLAAAIPAVWYYNKFNNEISRLNMEMETFGQDFLNWSERTFLV